MTINQIIQSLNGPLVDVSYTFSSDRAKMAPWHVRRVEFKEQISKPYLLSVDLVLDVDTFELEILLGDKCELVIERDLLPRSVYGIVKSVRYMGRVGGRQNFRVIAVPAFALLDLGQNSRAWQQLTAPEILLKVLDDALVKQGRRVDMSALKGEYPARDYCVQYRESDFVFASRLMEQEGLTYYFKHVEGAEVLVIVEDYQGFSPLEGLSGTRQIPLIDSKHETAKTESIQTFVWSNHLRSESVTQGDFDWLRPNEELLYTQNADSGAYPTYSHGERLFQDDGEQQATRALEQKSVGGRIGEGESNVVDLSPGYTFIVVDHDLGAVDTGEYLVTSVTHIGDCPEENILDVLDVPEDPSPRYSNTYECVPVEAPYRPEREHHQPRVYGPQTAIVTGPKGEEVHTDKHGRIMVKMYWDRESEADEGSSWWIRVAQTWAGPGFGSMTLPRIGMEVVVDFLEGNPDRPIVVGCVYNGENRPPYPLPKEKTKSTVKSNTSIGGGGFNELRFEDRKGAEEVFVHAQRDMNARVLRNRSETVGANASESVGANRTVTVGSNNKHTVGKDHTHTVKKNYTREVKEHESVEVTLTRTKKVLGGEENRVECGRTTEILEFEKVTITGPRTRTVVGDETITVDGSTTSSVTGSASSSVEGGSSMELVSGAKMLSVGETYDVSVGGGADGTPACSPNGAKIQMSETEIKLICGESSMALNKDGTIELSGVKISITGAGGDVKITGAGSEVIVKGRKIRLN